MTKLEGSSDGLSPSRGRERNSCFGFRHSFVIGASTFVLPSPRSFTVLRCRARVCSPFASLLLTGILGLLGGCRGGEETSAKDGWLPDVPLPEVAESQEDVQAQLREVERGSNQFHELMFKKRILEDLIRRQVGVEGHQQVEMAATNKGTACVDPQTGRIAFRALTCLNPDCPGRGKGGGPHLFVYETEEASIGPAGEVVWSTKPLPPEAEFPGIACPACGQVIFVRYYEPPEVILRRQALEKELREVREARQEARQANQPVPANLRTPNEIMVEMAELPKLFLIKEK